MEVSSSKRKFGFWKITGLTIALLLVSLISLAAIYEREIGSMVLKAINKQLKTELIVEEPKLSLIWKFPQAAVYLNNVKIDGVGGSKEPLMNVGSISLQCGIAGLFTGNYDFTSVHIKNGTINISIDRKGNPNYAVWISDSTSTETEATETSLNLAISNAILTQVNINYSDKSSSDKVKIEVSEANFNGNFSNTQFSLNSYAEIFAHEISLNGTRYVDSKRLAYDGMLDIDLEKGDYNFNKIQLFAEDNSFEINGGIKGTKKGQEYGIKIHSLNAELFSLLQLLPESVKEQIGPLKSHGDLAFEAHINGLQTARKSPILDVNLILANGRLSHPDMANNLKSVNFNLKFNSGNGINPNTAHLSIKEFNATLNQQPIKLYFGMKGYDNPLLNMGFNGKIAMRGLFGLLGDKVSAGDGLLSVNQLNIQGYLNDMTSMARIPRVSVKGDVSFEETQLRINDIDATVESGRVQLQNNTVVISDLVFRTPKSQLALNGQFRNVLPVLLSDSLNSHEAELEFKGALHSEFLDIDELSKLGGGYTAEELAQVDAMEKDSLIQETYERRALRTQYLKGSFITNIVGLKYDKFVANNFNGELAFDNNILKLKGVKVDAMDGSFELNSKVYFYKEPKIEAFIDCKSIDLYRMFDETNNLGQAVLTKENIRGRMDALVKLNIPLDSLGNLKIDALYALADVRVREGELIKVGMLEEFSKVIKLRDLEHIVFSEMTNQFKIERQVFHMPAMFLQSNAMNLVVAGTHGFDQNFDYKFKINAGQVLTSKFKKFNPKRKALKAKKQGLFNIYARVYGNIDKEDYQYKIGEASVKKALNYELNRQLPLIANTLQKEFNTNAEQLATPFERKINVQAIKEPDAWKDIPEYSAVDESWNDDDATYIDGF